MQRELIRLKRKKRARKRMLLVLGITFVMALGLVGMRACTGGVDQSYKKSSQSSGSSDLINPGNMDKLKELKKFMENR